MTSDEDQTLLENCDECGEQRGSTSPCEYCIPAVLNAFDQARYSNIKHRKLIDEHFDKTSSLSDLYGRCRAWISLLRETCEVALTTQELRQDERQVAHIMHRYALDALEVLKGSTLTQNEVIGDATYYSDEFFEIVEDAIGASTSLNQKGRYDDDILLSVLARGKYKETHELLSGHGVAPMQHLFLTSFHGESLRDWMIDDIESYPPENSEKRNEDEDEEAEQRFYNGEHQKQEKPEGQELESHVPYSLLQMICEMSGAKGADIVSPKKILEYILYYGNVDWSNYSEGAKTEELLLRSLQSQKEEN